MTFRENNAVMLGLIDSACSSSYSMARYNLAIGMVAQQKEITDLITELGYTEDSKKGFYLSFPYSYTNLFLNVFKDVNAAIKRLLNGEVLTTEEFNAINVQSIGIAANRLDNRDWVLYDGEKGNPYPNRITLHLWDVGRGYEGYKHFTFPEKFYYDHTHGGDDYGKIFLYDKDKTLSLSDVFWHDDIKCWGPFVYGTPESASEMTYSALGVALFSLYGRPLYRGDEKGVYMQWPAENPSLDKKLAVYSYRCAVYPINASPSTGDEIIQHALRVTTGYASSPAISYGYGFDNDAPHAANMLWLNSVSINGTAYWNKLLQITMAENMIQVPVVNLDITHNDFGNRYFKVENAKVVSIVKDTTYPNLLTKQVTVPFSRAGLVKYNFTDLIEGDFGEDKVTVGLDAQLRKASKTDTTVALANGVLGMLTRESKLDMTAGQIMSTVDGYTALVQLANLFSVQYAIERILYGHIHRVQK